MRLLVFTLHPKASARGCVLRAMCSQEMATQLSGGDAVKKNMGLFIRPHLKFFQQSKCRQDVLKSLDPAAPKGCAFGVAEPKVPVLEGGAGLGREDHGIRVDFFSM